MPTEPVAAPRYWGIATWRVLSLVAAWGLGMVSVQLAFRHSRHAEWALPAAGVALAAGIVVSGVFQYALLDWFSTFHFREKFAYFLAHAVLLIAPLGTAGRSWLWMGTTLILLSQSMQLVNPVGFHRFLAAGAALALAGLLRRVGGAEAWAVLWLAAAGGVLVLKRVRFVLEEYRTQSPGVAPGVVARATARSVLLPVLLAGLLGWWVSPPARPEAKFQRVESLGPGSRNFPLPSGAPGSDVGRLLWQAFFLAGSIIAAIALLNWYAARRGRREGRIPEAGEVLAASHALETPPPPPPRDPAPLDDESPRHRILRKFRQWEKAMAELDWGRKLEWTIRDYCTRLQSASSPPEADSPAASSNTEKHLGDIRRIFDKARYSPDKTVPEEASEFEQAANTLLDQARTQNATPPDRAPGFK